jgi:hypothetical protein
LYKNNKNIIFNRPLLMKRFVVAYADLAEKILDIFLKFYKKSIKFYKNF